MIMNTNVNTHIFFFFSKENTLAAIKEAKELGAYMVEVDVRHTKDDQLVSSHFPLPFFWSLTPLVS